MHFTVLTLDDVFVSHTIDKTVNAAKTLIPQRLSFFPGVRGITYQLLLYYCDQTL